MATCENKKEIVTAKGTKSKFNEEDKENIRIFTDEDGMEWLSFHTRYSLLISKKEERTLRATDGDSWPFQLVPRFQERREIMAHVTSSQLSAIIELVREEDLEKLRSILEKYD